MIKCHNKVTKQEKSRCFVLFWVDDGRIRIRTLQIMADSDLEVLKFTDPDPQH